MNYCNRFCATRENKLSRRNAAGGQALPEMVVTLLLFLPLALVLLYVVLQSCHAYSIKLAVDQAANRAAREMSVEYGHDPTLPANSDAQQAVYSKIRIDKFVISNEQFSQPTFNTAHPSTVTITCTYLPSVCLPPF